MRKLLQKFSSRLEAEQFAALLSSNEIRTELRADDAGGMLPNLSTTQGVSLYVEEKDVDRAVEIMGTSS